MGMNCKNYQNNSYQHLISFVHLMLGNQLINIIFQPILIAYFILIQILFKHIQNEYKMVKNVKKALQYRSTLSTKTKVMKQIFLQECYQRDFERFIFHFITIIVWINNKMYTVNNNERKDHSMRLRVKIPIQYSDRKFMVAVKRDWTIWKLANRALAVYKQLFYSDVRTKKFSKDLTVKSVLIDGYYMSKNQLVGNLLNCNDEIVCEIINTKSLFSEQQKQLIQKPINRIQKSFEHESLNKQLNWVKKESQNKSNQKQGENIQKQVQNINNLSQKQDSQSQQIKQSIFVREDMNKRFSEQNIEKMKMKKQKVREKRKLKSLAKKFKKTQQAKNGDQNQQDKPNTDKHLESGKIEAQNSEQVIIKQNVNSNLNNENLQKINEKKKLELARNQMIAQGDEQVKDKQQNSITLNNSKVDLSLLKTNKIQSKQRNQQIEQKIKKNKAVREKSSQDLKLGRDYSQSKSEQKFKLNPIGSKASPNSDPRLVPNIKNLSPKISSPKITFYKQTPKQDSKSPSSFAASRKISQEFSLNRKEELVPLNLDGDGKQKAKTNEVVKVKSKQKMEKVQKIEKIEKIEKTQKIVQQVKKEVKKKKVVVQEVSSDDDAKASPINIKQSHTNESSELPDLHNLYPKFKQMKDIEQHMKKYQIQLSDSEQQQ